MQTVLDADARSRCSCGESRSTPAGSGRPAARRRRAPRSGRTAVPPRRSRRPARRRPPRRRRASSRGSRRRRRGGTAARRAPSCRSAGRPRSLQRAAGTSCTPSPGWSGGSWTPSTNGTPGHGSWARRRLPSRSTWSKRDATCAAAEIPRPDFDHAAEHAAEPERARRVNHAHRLADAARLRELDVDPVRALGARGDVVERVAVLVDVDRHRRALLQLHARGVARRRAAARSTRRRAPRAAGGTRAPPRGSTPRSRRPGAGDRPRRRAPRARGRRRGRRGRRA